MCPLVTKKLMTISGNRGNWGWAPGWAQKKYVVQGFLLCVAVSWRAVRKLLRFPSLTWSSHLDDEVINSNLFCIGWLNLLQYLVEVKNKDNRPIPDEWTLHSKLVVTPSILHETNMYAWRTKTHARYQPPEVRAMLEERAQYKEMLQVTVVSSKEVYM